MKLGSEYCSKTIGSHKKGAVGKRNDFKSTTHEDLRILCF